MSVINELMGHDEIVVWGVDPSPLASREKWITVQLAQYQELLIIIQVMSNEVFTEIANIRLYIICRSTSGHPIDMILPFSMWLRYDLSSLLHNELV
jgi:hypothetical protein